MIQRIYVIYDAVAQEAGPLQCAKNDGIAARIYAHSIKDVEHKEDFKLMCVGYYETEKMDFAIFEKPVEVLEKTEVEE